MTKVQYYTDNAETLIELYDSVNFKDVHKSWLEYLPQSGNVLDVGSGSGRDARFMAELNLNVVSVEPALPLLDLARQNSPHTKITWLSDSLPKLNELYKYAGYFQLILLSAVWMHLSPVERRESLDRLATLLKNNGHIVITLRHGEFSDGRIAYPVSIKEVELLAKPLNLRIVKATRLADDELGRNIVKWQTVVLSK